MLLVKPLPHQHWITLKTVKSVLAAVQKVVDYDAAEVSVLRGNNLIVESWWGKDGFKDTTGRKYRIGKGPTGTIAATKETLYSYQQYNQLRICNVLLVMLP